MAGPFDLAGNLGIVTGSSIGGLRGSLVVGACNVSKAADNGPDNVRPNGIAPGRAMAIDGGVTI